MAKVFLIYIMVCIASYLVGSLNTSLILGKFGNFDIRRMGSGNAGFTNMLRTKGIGKSAIVIFGDALKAVLFLSFIKIALFKFFSFPTNVLLDFTYSSVFFLTLGHNFPIYFNFRGGKGIVVSAVGILFARPIIGVFVILISIVIMFFTRYVSFGSLVGTFTFALLSPIFAWGDWHFIFFSQIMSWLAVYMHRTNIKRLIKRTENHFNSSVEETAGS